MRKIEIGKWEEPDGKGEKREVTLLDVIKALIGNRKPEQLKGGFDGFRSMNRISKAFDKAEKSKFLELEETDYSLIKGIMEKDIPDTWGLDKNISEAIERFLNAEPEK